jgi:hypothetical protein
MTITHPTSIPTSSRKVSRCTATAAIFIAAVSIATTTATTADAEPKGRAEFDSCFADELNILDTDWSKISTSAVLIIFDSCCLQVGGTVDKNHVCTLPNGDVTKPAPLQLNPNQPRPTRETVQPGPTAEPGPVPPPVQPVG